MLNVAETFYSLQGESTFAGFPCCFIRLAGCNLRCAYCDSAYTWQKTGEEKTEAEIIAWLREYPEVMVELTGGEPLLQDNVYPLLQWLTKSDRTVLLETNGSLPINRVPAGIVIILDIKCPGSKMHANILWENIRMLKSRKTRGCHDEIKLVLTSAQDFHWAREQVRLYGLNEICPVMFSPVQDTFPANDLAQLILEYNVPVRLQLQLHKTLWPDIVRGV